MDEGDYFLDRSLDLLQRHLQLMLLSEQVAIRQRYLESVFHVLCRAAESLKCDIPAYQCAGHQKGVTLRRLQRLLVPKVHPSQKV
jgi:hypothetical protein